MFDINYFIKKFKTYTHSFIESEEDSAIKTNIEHKIRHSLNVLENSRNIAKSENYNDEDFFIAELCGLFHDIGRFEQFSKYRTFKDSETLYHGQLGVEVLKKEKFLSSLPEHIIEIVYCTTYSHGLIEIPQDFDGQKLNFSKLVRDADKLDIFSIIAKYTKVTGPRNIAQEYGLSNDASITNSILQSFYKKERISKSDIKTLNDLKVIQLSWIFDLNFAYSLEYVKKSTFLDIIIGSITDKSQIEDISIFINNILNTK